MNYYSEVIRKYAVFEGRSRRSEYWYFVLFNTLIMMGASIIDSMLGLNTDRPFQTGLIGGLYALAVFLPMLAVTVRRLHDTNHSGWMVLISLIPIIGTIWLLLLMVLDGDSGINTYGPNPKATQSVK